MRRSSRVALLLGLFVSGCRTSTEPSAAVLRGIFVVRSLNGVALPADFSGSSSYQLMLMADTLRFDGKGTASRRWTMQQQFAGDAPITLSYALDYDYRIADHTLYLEVRCSPLANCVGSPTGRAVGHDSLLVQSGSVKYLFVRQ